MSDQEFNPLLDDDDSEDVSGSTDESLPLTLEDAEEAFALPTAEEIDAAFERPAKRKQETAATVLPDDFDDALGELEHLESEANRGIRLPENPGAVGFSDELDDLISDLGLNEEFESSDLFVASGDSDDLFSDRVVDDQFSVDWNIEDELLGREDDEDDDPLSGFKLDEVLAQAIDLGASDIDIIANDEVSYEILGDMHRASEFGMVTPEITSRLQLSIISHVLESDFVENLELDTAYVLRNGKHEGRRMRLSIGKSFGEIFLVFRVISDNIPTPDELGIPKELQDMCRLPSGAVLICGPTGSGKSTTFTSILRQLQLTQRKKILTIEKPVEYVYPKGPGSGLAVIVQREVGKDARGFAPALKSGMRQHPKIIMVGEVRDQEEVDELLRASETGHLALTTLHATSPPGAISRIMSMYEGEDRLRILTSMKDNFRGIANQTLVKSVDGTKRTSVYSILAVTPEVSEMIGRGDVEALQKHMRDNETTMDHGLIRAVEEGKCSLEEAESKSPYPAYFRELARAKKLS